MHIIRRILLYIGFIDLKNYFYIIKFYHKNKNSEIVSKYNIRMDWIGRLYGTINLRDEDMGNSQDVIEALVLEKMKDLILWLDNNNLQDIISYPKIYYIENSISFLFIFKPLFYIISWLWLIIIGIIFFIIHVMWQNIVNYFNIIFEIVKNII